MSGADKLRAIYTTEFRFTADRLPIVPVAIAEGLREVTLSSDGGLRVLPEGEGGPELRADGEWRVHLEGGTPARIRYWTVVFRGGPNDGAAAEAEVRAWKDRGRTAHNFDQGTLFAVAGEVLDRREVLVGVGPHKSAEEAERAAEALAALKKAPLGASGVYSELAERPHGMLEATGGRSGTRLRNEGQIWFAPAGDAPIKVLLPGGPRTFFGRVYATIDRNGTLAVVNAVPEDRLLAGLVPAEIFPSAPDDALRAQAVAARGELLAKIGTRHLTDPYRLCSTTHCQVYSGTGKETPRTTAAVEATRGLVLFGADGKALADPVYSANCGGHGENVENVWPDIAPDATLRGHADGIAPPWPAGTVPDEAAVAAFLRGGGGAYCARTKIGSGDRFRWTVHREAAELGHLLEPLGVGTVTAIEVTQRGVSGRAREVHIVGSKKTVTVRGELKIRQTFGGLRSSLFVVKVEGGAATFTGGGFGHGVGLCQTGAVGMAEAGKTFRQILGHYYPGSVLRKMW